LLQLKGVGLDMLCYFEGVVAGQGQKVYVCNGKVFWSMDKICQWHSKIKAVLSFWCNIPKQCIASLYFLKYDGHFHK
jgi:hypothetical protein